MIELKRRIVTIKFMQHPLKTPLMKEYRDYKYFLPNIIGVILSFVLLIMSNIFTAVIFFSENLELLNRPWDKISSDIALAGFFLIPANCVIFFWVSIVLEIFLSFIFYFFVKNHYLNRKKRLIVNLFASPLFSFLFYIIIGILGITILFLL